MLSALLSHSNLSPVFLRPTDMYPSRDSRREAERRGAVRERAHPEGIEGPAELNPPPSGTRSHQGSLSGKIQTCHIASLWPSTAYCPVVVGGNIGFASNAQPVGPSGGTSKQPFPEHMCRFGIFLPPQLSEAICFRIHRDLEAEGLTLGYLTVNQVHIFREEFFD